MVDLRDVSRWWRCIPGVSWRHQGDPASDLRSRERYPVVHVAREDAAAFAPRVDGRSPSEAEWEFAARAGRASAAHAWGDAPHAAEHPRTRNYDETIPSHAPEPAPVGSYPANGYELYDMSGNVWQWTADWYSSDTNARDAFLGGGRNPTGPAADHDMPAGDAAIRVVRGGSFRCSKDYCRGYCVRAPGTKATDTGASHIGFRVVRSATRRSLGR